MNSLVQRGDTIEHQRLFLLEKVEHLVVDVQVLAVGCVLHKHYELIERFYGLSPFVHLVRHLLLRRFHHLHILAHLLFLRRELFRLHLELLEKLVGADVDFHSSNGGRNTVADFLHKLLLVRLYLVERSNLRHGVYLVVEFEGDNQQTLRTLFAETRGDVDVVFGEVADVDALRFEDTASHKSYARLDSLFQYLADVVCVSGGKLEVDVVLIVVVDNEKTALIGANVLDKIADDVEREVVHVIVVLAEDVAKLSRAFRNPVLLAVEFTAFIGLLVGFDEAVAHREERNAKLVLVAERGECGRKVATSNFLGEIHSMVETFF